MAKQKTFDSNPIPGTGSVEPKEPAPQTEPPVELDPIPGTESVVDMGLGDGELVTVPVTMRRMWLRDVPGVTDDAIKAGPVCIAHVTMREGVDLNLLVDAIRSGYAGGVE